MTEAIQMQGQYLKCDACDYVTGNLGRDLTKADIGTPCPKCGADMLTERDFNDFVGQMAAIAFVNKATEMLADAIGLETKRVRLNIHTHNGVQTIVTQDA